MLIKADFHEVMPRENTVGLTKYSTIRYLLSSRTCNCFMQAQFGYC